MIGLIFGETDFPKEILKKISLVKITKMIKLIQKTEILLRKNSSHYLNSSILMLHLKGLEFLRHLY